MSARKRTVALCVLCMCALTAGIDMTITNVALPFIGRSLDARTSQLQWAVDAYNIALAGLLVLGGALADRYGRRRVFLASYSLFALASVLAAVSPSIDVLIAARALMGVGGAGVTAPALAIIASMYRPDERSRAIVVFVVFGATGLAVGPILGGLLLNDFWWGSVFLVNVPIIVAGVLVGARTIPESRAPVPDGGLGRLDVIGAALSVVALGGLLFGVIEGPGRGWTAPEVLAALFVGIAALTAFVVRELRVSHPLFDVGIVRRAAVATGGITLLVAYLLFSTFLFINPQYLQDVRQESIVAVGLLFLPFAVVFALSSLRAGRTMERLGARATIPLGLVASAGASVALAVSLGGPLWATITGSALLGLGLSLLIAPPSTVVMNALPAAKAGDGSSLNFVSRFVGAAIGVAIAGSILASGYTEHLGGAALTSLDPRQVDKARGSLQGALEVSESIAPSEGEALAAAAREAFDRGAYVAYLVMAVLAVAAAVVAWMALGRHTDDVEPSR